LFVCMFDSIFVTYKSMMTVSTQRVCGPPRYATTPVLLCVHAVPVFLKYDDVSVLPPNLVRWTHPFNAVVFVPSLNLLYYNDVSTSMIIYIHVSKHKYM